MNSSKTSWRSITQSHWQQFLSITQPYWQRFVAITRPYWVDPGVKWEARAWLAGVLTLLGIVVLINLKMSYLNKTLMDSLQDIFASNVMLNQAGANTATLLQAKAQHLADAYKTIGWFLGLFAFGACLIGAYHWVRDRLILHWRAWMTADLSRKYFAGAYYRLNCDENSADNPDDRIQEVREFVRLLVILLADFLESALKIIVFLAVLYKIYPWLLPLAIVYPAAGSVVMILLFIKLIQLKFKQLVKEADFRFSLGHVRRYAEQIAFYQGAEQEAEEVRLRFMEVVSNYKLVLLRALRVTVASKFYKFMIIVIPTLIMLPALRDSKLTLGDLTQADMAFAMIMESMSLVVLAYEDITSFLAQTVRLGTFNEALEAPVETTGETIQMQLGSSISLEDVTLLTPDRKLTLIEHLSLTVAPGKDLLIIGPSGAGKSSLFRAIRGLPLWNHGEGTILRPEIHNLMFIPQAPYMMMRTSLRKQLFYPFGPRDKVSDADLYRTLAEVNLSDLPSRLGANGLDETKNWANVLSLGEQQRLAAARLLLAKPQYVFFDEGTNSLDRSNEQHICTIVQKLQSSGSTFISIAHNDALTKLHKQILELTGDGNWRLYPAGEEATAETLPSGIKDKSRIF